MDCLFMSDDLTRLHEIDRLIASGRERLVQQKRRIAELQSKGYNAAGSMALLREEVHYLHLMTAQRRFIARTLGVQDGLKTNGLRDRWGVARVDRS
jgi:hypothetical protein